MATGFTTPCAAVARRWSYCMGEGIPASIPSCANSTHFPQLKRVIAVAADKVVMEPTLDEALNELFGNQQPLQRSAQPPLPASTPQPALEKARALLDEARKAMQQGDWAQFGTAMERLERQLAGPTAR